MQMERKMPCIPNDIVIEIFLLLPAKSLIRLRWACKYWFDLITRDHDFIKKHHLHCSTTTTHDDRILSIINYKTGDDVVHRFFQTSLDYSDTTTVIGDVSSTEVCLAPCPSPDYPHEYHAKQFLGSCNGLILFHCYITDIFCIWNPCTKEYKILPHSLNIEGFSRNHFDSFHYGFSYDHTTDDYQVIRNTYYYLNNDHPYLYTDVQIYTLGTNSWRRVVVDGPKTRRLWRYGEEGVSLNGVVYWTDFEHGNMISFDIEREIFKHVSKIPNLSNHGEHRSYVKMRVFEGSMCVVIRNPDHGGADMWVMKDYGVMNNNNESESESESEYESSWTKLLTIPNQEGKHLFPIIPHRFTRNGELIMVTYGYYLCLYDPKNNNVKTLSTICDYSNCRYLIDVYTESLVSLNSGTYIG